MITVRRKLTFNLSRYESMDIEVTLDGLPDDTEPEAISQQLDITMASEVYRAGLATVHDPDDNVTSVHKWNEIIEQTTEGA